MLDDPLSLLSAVIWLAALGTWPVGFLFGACSPCCQGDPCPWLLEFDRCLRVSIVGSDPQSGGDCLLLSRRDGTGDVEYMRAFSQGSLLGNPFNPETLQIHNVQSRIRIPIRLSLSASGASRTPVGETRTQVWRFLRATPTSPAATVYDVLGPPWHLQVDVSVTGVATQAEAGVVSSLETDEHGQPKVVLTVSQWTATITHQQVVTLFPAGLQRWGPQLSGTQPFRLTSNLFPSGTLAAGDSYSGWSVQMLTGMVIEERKLAVRVVGSLCDVGGGGGFISEKIILDEVAAASFLSGDTPLRVNVSNSNVVADGERDLFVTDKNALCGIHRDFLSTGIEIGVYPEQIYAEPPEGYPLSVYAVPSLEALPPYCSTGLKTLRLFGSFQAFWRTSWNYRGFFYFTGGGSGLQAGPSLFYAGWSLLYNLENGPYRTTATASGPTGFHSSAALGTGTMTWTFYLEGESDPYFDRPEGLCPEGTQYPPGAVLEGVNYFSLCTATPLAMSGEYEGTYELTGKAPAQASGLFAGTLIRDRDNNVLSGLVPWSIGFFARFLGDPIEETRSNGTPVTLIPEIVLFFQIRPTCELSGDLDLGQPVTLSAAMLSADGISSFALNLTSLSLDNTSVGFSSSIRPSCGEWTSAPAEGGQITRSCDGADESYETATIISRNADDVFAARLPARLGAGIGSPNQLSYLGPAPTQLGRCNLLGVRISTSTNVAVPALHFQSPTTGSCVYYIPFFGFSTGFGSSVPCDNCTVSVTQTAGEENGTVTLITSGDKAGVIEIIAARTWLGGQGVTFTVSCGGDTITQVVRRQDTAPEAPANLTAVRSPCSTATLAWQAPHDGGQPITGYRVEYRPFNIGSYILFDTVAANALSAVVTGLLRVGYQFRVAAINSVGTGTFSVAAVDGSTLGAPTGLTFTRDPCNQVQLSWVAPTQSECVVVANYRLEYRVGITGTFLVFGTVAGTATTGTITGLDPTLRYQFRVARVADAGGDLFSNTVTSGSVPAVPTGVAAALGAEPGEVDLTWNAVEQLCFPNTDYLVQFRPSTTSTWSDFTRAASTDKFATVTGLTAGVTYFFRVRATNSIGNSGFSAQSNSVTIPEPE